MSTRELSLFSHLKGKKKNWFKGGRPRSRPRHNKRKKRNTGKSKPKQMPKLCEDSKGVFEYVEPSHMLPHCLKEVISHSDYYPCLRPMNECKWFWENCRRMSEWKAHFQFEFGRSQYVPSVTRVDRHPCEEKKCRPVPISNSTSSSQLRRVEEGTNLYKSSSSKVHKPIWLETQHEKDRSVYFRKSNSNLRRQSSETMHSNADSCESVVCRHVEMNKLSNGLNRSTSSQGIRSDESLEFHVNEEMLAFLEQSIRHKMELNKQREKEKKDLEKTKLEFEFDSTVCPQHITKQRLAEMKLLYGNASPKIIAMETALHLTFERRLSKKKCKLWPIMPLKL